MVPTKVEDRQLFSRVLDGAPFASYSNKENLGVEMLRIGMVQRLLAIGVSFCVAFGAPLAVQAAAEKNEARAAEVKKAAEGVKDIRSSVKFTLEFVKTRDQIIELLGRGNASIEALKAIDEDLEKRGLKNQQELPAMTLKDDEVYIDGKATGLQFISFSPAKIKYQRKIWTYNPNKSTDVNYLSLVSFIEKGSKSSTASFLKLLLPEAKAFFGFNTWGSGMGSGALIGGGAGLLMAGLFGLPLGPAALIGVALGAGVGGLVGWLKQRRERNAPPPENPNYPAQ